MNFLIDIGNVLLSLDFEGSLGRLLAPGCDDAPQRFARLLERKDAFESGELDTALYIAEASGHLGFEGPEAEFRAAWCGIFAPIEPMWQLVDELAAAGHTLILFSNINAIHAPYVLESYPVFGRFHGAVFSHEVGAIKPDERIYQEAIARYQLAPGETIYIDDLAANIATGERLGFQAFRYDLGNHAALLDWLAPRLGPASR